MKKRFQFQVPSKSLWLLFWTSLFYGFVYLGTNWISSERSFYYNLYFEWEKQIPIVPLMIFFYLGAYLLPLLPLFVLNYKKQLLVAKSIILSGVVAGTIFLFFPTQLGFERALEPLGAVGPLFEILWFLDLPHNLVPSLHVTMSYLMIIPCLKEVGMKTKMFFLFIFFNISISVVLVHQHHLFDLFAGLILGIVCFDLVKRYSRNRALKTR